MQEEWRFIAPFLMEIQGDVDGDRSKNLRRTIFQRIRRQKILFVGDGAKKAQEILQISGADFNENVYPSAKYLIKKSVEKFNRQDF